MNYESAIFELKRLKPVSVDVFKELVENKDLLIDSMRNRIKEIDPQMYVHWKRISKSMNNDQFMHADFISCVFKYDAYETLVRSQAWLHRVHRAHKIPWEYMVKMEKFWVEAVNQTLSKENANAITPIYEWLMANCGNIDEMHIPSTGYGLVLDDTLNRIREDFLVYLLIGDFCKCLSIASEYVVSVVELQRFYLQILQPCMYEIGYLWENGEITTAQEHLACTMANRVMSYIYTKANMVTNLSYKAIVAAVPREFHELGSRMVADFLELYGWRVKFLGSNTPADSLIDLIDKEKPDILALSVTMFYNIEYAVDLISEIKKKFINDNLKVIVGGQAFQMERDIWKCTGADGYSKDAKEAVDLARKLVRNTDMHKSL